jgi:hypothetical protein
MYLLRLFGRQIGYLAFVIAGSCAEDGVRS